MKINLEWVLIDTGGFNTTSKGYNSTLYKASSRTGEKRKKNSAEAIITHVQRRPGDPSSSLTISNLYSCDPEPLWGEKAWVSNKHIWSEMSTTWEHIKMTLKGDYWNDARVFSRLGLEYRPVHGHANFCDLLSKSDSVYSFTFSIKGSIFNTHVLLICPSWHCKASDKT